jgi:hypothetical protein
MKLTKRKADMLVIKPVNISFSFLFYMPIFFEIRKREKLKIQIVDNFSVYNLVIIFLFF